MKKNHPILENLAEQYCGEKFLKISQLPLSGSNRLYFRFIFQNHESIIGVYNEDIQENRAFFHFQKALHKNRIHVPKLLAISENQQYYLLHDLGDENLFSLLSTHRNHDIIDDKVVEFYQKTVKILPHIQTIDKEIDFSYCYPRNSFDRQSMQWDLNYFKYYFIKLLNIPFHEQKLEDDFNTLINFLLEADSHYFLYRDFQSRNIMIHDNDPYFIDFQGGRKGALQYDVASLLYDGKANLSESLRIKLLDLYLEELVKICPVTKMEFLKYYYSFVLIRILQAMGTYGFRGYYEKKAHFLASIPFAIDNIRYLLENVDFQVQLPELFSVLERITQLDIFQPIDNQENILTVIVNSFSYKSGIPLDLSTNGGGFVFDCRALPNPGREVEFQQLTGKDALVIECLEKYEETTAFKHHSFALIDASIKNYLDRKFTRLMVSYGCTGGQHRSVYFAESLDKHLADFFPQIKIILNHKNKFVI
ncbi:MAG: phosphotransferase [Bacteroidales bacterium]|nr:phosphotransferase [Bacteroidales bacterium]